jgi:chromosome transmission fidelity protein 1
VLKGGILVFFTSYQNMEECLTEWKRNSYTFGVAKIFKEERDHKSLMESYNNYSKAISENGRGLFLCTCRGKLSEGLNFSDDLARACFVIGIPISL